MNPRKHKFLIVPFAVVAAGGIALGACGGSSSTGSAGSTSTPRQSAGGATKTTKPATGTSQVLPVTTNPIANTSTVQGLKIPSVIVENNVGSNKKTVSDHLEIALQNTGASPLSGFEVFYTFTDSTTKITESYYAKLPASFTIPAGGMRAVHFDDTGAPDHFPVNKYSLYSTSKNALKVSVEVSATDAAVQTVTVKKDAGGQENAAE